MTGGMCVLWYPMPMYDFSTLFLDAIVCRSVTARHTREKTELPCGSWWRPTGGKTRLGVWTRPSALYSPGGSWGSWGSWGSCTRVSISQEDARDSELATCFQTHTHTYDKGDS